jgi:2-polyprenyl-3-methyl-5-hydroxy-6-metoxy-1,4-benzoquinol methylase
MVVWKMSASDLATRTNVQNRTYFGHPRVEMLRLLPSRRSRVLEVGCGEGRFSAAIEGVAELWGVEPDPEAAAVASRKMKTVLVGTYEAVQAELPDAYFDLVICNDVIEHMADHDLFLAEIKQKLAPRGVIVGSVPNVRYFKNLLDLLVLKDWHYKDSGILDCTHLRYFTIKSLRRSLLGAGYRIDILRGINGNIRLQAQFRHLVYCLFGAIVILITAGHSRDVQYMQIAFRAEPLPTTS